MKLAPCLREVEARRAGLRDDEDVDARTSKRRALAKTLAAQTLDAIARHGAAHAL